MQDEGAFAICRFYRFNWFDPCSFVDDVAVVIATWLQLVAMRSVWHLREMMMEVNVTMQD